MIRTSISCVVLFGALLFVSRSLHESRAQEEVPRLPTDKTVVAPDASATASDRVTRSGPQAAGKDEPMAGPRMLAVSGSPDATSSSAVGWRRTRRGATMRTERVADNLSEPGSSGPPQPSADPPLESSLPDLFVEQESQTESLQPEASPGEEEFTPELVELRGKIRNCLGIYYRRLENASQRSPWGIMHTLIGFGVDTEIYAAGRKVNAIGWLCYNGSGRGQRLFYTINGQLRTSQGPGVQGHQGQFLAMLAQSRVKADYPIKVDGYEFTIEDLIQYEKQTCQAGTELTFKLIGLAHYLDSDERWQNEQGQAWDIPRLIKEELAQPVIGAACGGTHRMMGFSYAVRKREKRGEPMTGQWLRAKKYVDAYHEYTFKLQNPDGSFSTNWFAGRGDWGGQDRRLETTGHILEWLVYSLPEEQLRDPRVIKAVDYLATLLLNNQNNRWEVGPRGHALHALALYNQRLFGAKPGHGLELAAGGEGGSTTER